MTLILNRSSLLTMLLSTVFVIACSEKSDKEEDTASVNAETHASGEDHENLVILDYPKSYCEHVGAITTRTDISDKIAFICDEKDPSNDFLKLRAQALDQDPGEIKLSFLRDQYDETSDYSEFLIAWSFHVPIRPFEVKDQPIYQYVASGYESEDISLQVETSMHSDVSLDSGLHLWSVDMNYDLSIRGTANRFLISQRQTQYNLYQVLSGNEEMGLGVEHLIDVNNPDFDVSTMVNFSFNDGHGYNDGQGGTVVITLLHFVINNHGFPATARRSIEEIAGYIADVMYQGLAE